MKTTGSYDQSSHHGDFSHRTILVPTDFSESAKNAADYAMLLAKEVGASVLLYHAYHIPVPTAEMSYQALSFEQVEEDNRTRLAEYRNELLADKGRGVSIACLSSPGLAVDEITALLEEKPVSLIVMGTSGIGKRQLTTLGSVTTGVLRNTRTPMLIVPERAHFVHPAKIAFVYDYESEISPKVLEELKEFMAPFKAQLYIIDVDETKEKIAPTKNGNGIRLEQALESIKHMLHFSTGTDFIAGLIKFDETHKVDLLVMVPKRHSLFARMFHPSNTRKMAFHTQTPILALHE